jgi:hypothetical protein
MSITLIANTGLQFFSFETKIDFAIQKEIKFRYIERYDSRRRKFWFDEVVVLKSEDEVYARKSELENLGYLNSKGVQTDDIDFSKFEHIAETDIFEVGNLNQVFKYFEKKWIPVPFFKKNNINNNFFGPTDWVRIYFERTSDVDIKIMLLVDTSTSSKPDDFVSPFIHENPNENVYGICPNDQLTMSFVDSLQGCEWVEDYITKLFYTNNVTPEQPFLKHLANYIFLIRFLRNNEKLPDIQLLSDKLGNVDLDLIIDVGNSNTCAVLFENNPNGTFNFNAVKKLKIQDFSQPFIQRDQSFSTRIVFKEASFGALNSELNQNNKFQWPSPARIGFEAERIINDANVELTISREVKSYNSSPKRYLWDNKIASTEWEYHVDADDIHPKRVYKRGISEQIKSDGNICEDGIFGSKSQFSRKSLMTFVYLEIFSQALRQINSLEFRTIHGNPSKKRQLKRIIISCPTAMTKLEQINLRECAEQAMRMINKYNELVFKVEAENDIYANKVEVIPSVKDLKYDLYNIDKKKDWIYDEATAPQLLFLYGMIKHKFDGNPDLLFNLMGKPGTSLNKTNHNRSLTIGSLDIGGGTTDLMICKYDYNYNEITELTPDPLYWESLNLAGDDLLKEIIQQIIIEGKVESPNNAGCTGVIETYARENGINDVAKKLNGFFGNDSNNIGHKGKLMRTNFLNQIAIPIAIYYLEAAANLVEGKKITFDEIFPDKKPSKDLLNYFEKHFGFRFESITWNISTKKVNDVIVIVFSRLLKQIANIMDKYACDLIILSGKVFSIQSLEALFSRYHPISPNRLINFNKYWIGRWYPFADNNGYIHDSKTAVTIGSLIAYLGSVSYKLDKFRINTIHLRNKLISTADYIGSIKDAVITDSIITPKKEEGSITIHSLPHLIGFKNLNVINYPARNIYSLEFNEDRIMETLMKSAQNDPNKILDSLEAFKQKLRMRMPYKVTFSREFEKDKEQIVISEILDHEQNDIAKGYFELNLQTLPEKAGYWLDTGQFTLNIRN